jgi:hypothetical protein
METLIINSNSKKDIQIIKEIALKFGMQIEQKHTAKVNKNVPNAETLEAMQEAESGTKLISVKNKSDFYKKMRS